ncbi:MAG: TetR/AcrR family transcriptional regulator [Halieaceae bacterium]
MNKASAPSLTPILVPAAGKLERTRQRLLQAIREEAQASGNFSAEQVAARAGISTATFYNHFATKDEALLAAGEGLLGEMLDMVREQCSIEKLLDQGLYDFAYAWLERAIPIFSNDASLLRLLGAATERSDDLKALARRHQESLLEVYARFIELGQAASVVRPGDKDVIARVLLVTAESWNHPLMQRLEPGSAFHHEMSQTLARILAP